MTWLKNWLKIVRVFFRGPQHTVRLSVRYGGALRRVNSLGFDRAKPEWRYRITGENRRSFSGDEISEMRRDLLKYLNKPIL